MESHSVEIDIQHSEPPLILGIDVGSSSARAALLDSRGRLVTGTRAHVPHQLRTTPDGGAELDPSQLTEAVETVIDGALAATGQGIDSIHGVATSTFWHSLMGIDGTGSPTTPVYMWADIRAAEAAGDLAQRLDAAAYHRRTGVVPHPSYPAAKLLWLRRTQPDIWSRTVRWLSFGEYLHLRLLGQAPCSTSMASGTGLFSQAGLVWDDDTLAAVGLGRDQLSPIDDNPVTGLRPEYKHRWPVLGNIPWFPALGDGACSNVGAGAVGRGRLAIMVGTSGAMRLLWTGARLAPPPGLWLYRLDARRVLTGGALSEGGNLFRWVRERFRLPGPEDLEDALARIPPDSHGLTWLPFLAGERSPGWSLHARATITGLTLDTPPVAILRAGLEAVAYRFALIEQAIQAAVPGERTIIATGAALLNAPVWLQIMADVLGCPVLASEAPEASLRGAALVVLERLGVLDDLTDPRHHPVASLTRYNPDLGNYRIYQQAIARQQALYDQLRP